MKPCWRDYGLTEEGAAVAEAAIDAMVSAVRLAGPVARDVFGEAMFRVDTLPGRSPAFQRKYRKANGVKP